MAAAVLIDAGPLVAIIDQEDPHHEAVVGVYGSLRGQAYTIWPALAEACHMLRRRAASGDVDKLLDQVAQGVLNIAELHEDDISPIRTLLTKYSDQRLDLADAALTWVIERDRIETLITLDERDFRPIERALKGRLKLVVPKSPRR